MSHVIDEIPTPPPAGPGATVAGLCGTGLVVAGFIVTSNLLWMAGVVVLVLAFLYAHLRDKRQREYMADEHLRQQRLRGED